MGLAPNAARLSVRLFYHNSFGNFGEFSKHYETDGNGESVLGNQRIPWYMTDMWETVNQKAKDKKPVSNMASMVLQAILSGGRYPASLYTDTLIRIKAEQGKVSWGRAGIIKAYLIKNRNGRKEKIIWD